MPDDQDNEKKAPEPKAAEPGDATPNVEDIAKRVAALDEGDELERLAREEEAKLAERRQKRGGKKQGLESAASKRLARIGEKAKPKRVVPDAVEAADPLIERTQQLGAWARKNKNLFQGLIVAGVLVAAGVFVWIYLDHKKSSEASVALAQAVADERGEIGDPDKDDEGVHDKVPIFRTADDRREAALGKYREVAAKYHGTGAAWLARLGEGALLLDKRDADGAIAAFQEVSDSSLARADAEVRGRALENLGFAYELRAELHPDERDKNLDLALAQYKLLESTDVLGFKQMAPYHEARCYYQKGDKAKAIELLKGLREELMKSVDNHIFMALREVTDDWLRQLNPGSIPAKGSRIGAGGQLSPELLEKLSPEVRQRLNLGNP